ncbi:hypothetical protein P8C59_009168 [Phyllachora maydis]|uniref:Phosphatidylinositol 3-kinase VPS34 n=1 Tax=Phyllachora maydis TaxID=1825666 RepID=A0AAD9IDJ1_9PEZI|nr:hypothetical protein P8C59_009168 [Phyllachora maydis]
MEPFSFACSSSLDFPVSIRIINLEGDEVTCPFSTLLDRADLRHTGSVQSAHSDLQVTVQLWAGSKPWTVPVQTAYKAFRTERRWNEWLTLPMDYSTLPSNAQLAITLWDLAPAGADGLAGPIVPFGGTTLRLFDGDNQLQKGRQKCRVHRHRAADGYNNSTTPSTPDARDSRRRGGGGGNQAPVSKDADELERMEKLFKKHEMGEMPRVDWLDQLVFRGFEKRGVEAARSSLKTSQRQRQRDAQHDAQAAVASSSLSRFVLNVELPRFDFPVVFADHEYPPPALFSDRPLSGSGSGSHSALVPRPPADVPFGPGINGPDRDGLGSGPGPGPGPGLDLGLGLGPGPGPGPGPGDDRLIRVFDPEVAAKDNPAETKHRRLVRSQHRHGVLDKDLKPNAAVRDELATIMAYSPTHVLLPEEKDLVWKFRYHLTREKKALTKFVKSVNWADAAESKQAVQVLARWTDMDVDDALELLGPSFDHSAVRAFAVNRLRKADDHELLLYLLQLVQALRYEHIVATDDGDDGDDDDDDDNDNPNHDNDNPNQASDSSSLARFLIARAADSFLLCNYFYWYLMVECDDDRSQAKGPGPAPPSVFSKVAFDLMKALDGRADGREYRRTLKRQAEWVATLSRLSVEVKGLNKSIAGRTEHVKHFLADGRNELVTIDPPLPLPLDPTVLITGAVPDDAVVFKSSLHPIKVAFRTRDPHAPAYAVLFKTGDDLRQDQLVIQIISLMDALLQRENLDLKLSPYKILATSTTAGLSQFVPSTTFSALAHRHPRAPALAYLRANNPDAAGPLGLRKDALDTFLKSCAGYCVVTYLLGVGDRHLDNLLLAPDGRFFHADFGFILGRDPKPFAPAVKLSREMVEAMGGPASPHYRQFKSYAALAFGALRKNSHLVLNLFALMVDANIPDIRLEPDKAVAKVQDRFDLDVPEADAVRKLDRVIEDNLHAMVPVVMDKIHELVQAFRA